MSSGGDASSSSTATPASSSSAAPGAAAPSADPRVRAQQLLMQVQAMSKAGKQVPPAALQQLKGFKAKGLLNVGKPGALPPAQKGGKGLLLPGQKGGLKPGLKPGASGLGGGAAGGSIFAKAAAASSDASNLLQRHLKGQGFTARPPDREQQLSAYKRKYLKGQQLHETQPDEWKVLDPRIARSVPSLYDKWRLVGAFIESKGLISCQLDNFNSFVEQGLKDIVLHKSNVEVRCDADPNWYIKYENVWVGKPKIQDEKSLQELDIYPHQCRLRDLTYSAPIYVRYHYYCGKKAMQQHFSPFAAESSDKSGGGGGGPGVGGSSVGLEIARLPIMLRSKHCHLHGLSDEEQMARGECPLDPGGYFVIDGTEKVLMMQENMCNNRIVVEKVESASSKSASAKDNPNTELFKVQSAVVSSTNENKSRIVVCYGKNGALTMKASKFQTPVNIIAVIKGMGCVWDQEICQMIGTSSEILTKLLPSFQECKELGVFTQAQALDYLGKNMKDRWQSARSLAQNQAPKPKWVLAKEVLEQAILTHVPMDAGNTHSGEGRFGVSGSAGGSNQAPPHLPMMMGKVRFLCIMIRRIFAAQSDPAALDNKDYYGIKRVEQASSMISMLFEDLFKTFNTEIRKRADIEIGKLLPTENYTELDLVRRCADERITMGLKYAMKSGNWRIQRFRVDRSGVSQVLSRFSYMIALGSMTKVKSNVEKSVKIAGPRALQPSQWGMLCPADTPEGEQCGLIKNLSLMATVSTGLGEGADRIMRPLLQGLGVQSADLLSGDEMTPDSKDTMLVFCNGQLIGGTRNPGQFVKDVKMLRRRGLIFQFTSIYSHESTRTINISCDEGRLCRPLIIVENGVPAFKPEIHVPYLLGRKKDPVTGEEKPHPKWKFADFLNNGVCEFVDVNEENNLLIAMHPSELNLEALPPNDKLHPDPKYATRGWNNKLAARMGADPAIEAARLRNPYLNKSGIDIRDYTHLEIEPLSLFGIISGLVAYPNHNQSPRNTYTCAMGKQAMGCLGYNQLHRTDNVIYLLQYPQKPLCKSKTLDFAKYDKFGAGQNASVAVISYSGYDIEDAIVMNRNSIDRGFGRCVVMKRHVVTCSGNERVLEVPQEAQDSGGRNRGRGNPKAWLKLDQRDGIVFPAQKLKQGDILLNKKEPEDARMLADGADQIKYRDAPIFHKQPVEGNEICDRVLITQNDQHYRIYKIMYRETRRPELGDKFASRHGQKGVVGLIVKGEDMPFSETGWCPDLIMNPHGFPSRMTVGKMLELVGSKAAALEGTFNDGSAFGGTPPELIYKTLIRNGFNPTGKELLTSGLTGETMSCYVFVGPIFYQKLKHMVADKVQARARGKLNMLTRQPTEGRAKEGGLRMGEMERDCLIGYGASNLLLERLNFSSDVCDVKVCRECGLFADRSAGTGTANYCRYCDKSGGKVIETRVPYACKLLIQEMQGMNVVARIGFEEVGG